MNEAKLQFEIAIDKLVRVVSRAQALHGSTHDFGTGVSLYRSEIHTIQAIGNTPGIHVTALAETLGITKSAISQTLGKLERKGLILKSKGTKDAREVSLSLTSKGWVGYHNHEMVHETMFDLVKTHFEEAFETKLSLFETLMDDLEGLMDAYEKKMKHGKRQ